MGDANGLGSWIWIDAFDIENGSGVCSSTTAWMGGAPQHAELPLADRRDRHGPVMERKIFVLLSKPYLKRYGT